MVDSEEEIRRGRLAEEVIANPAFVDALALVRTGIIDAWCNCPIRDQEGQHELKLMLKASANFEGCLKATIGSGKLATLHIESLKKEVSRGRQRNS